MFTVLPRTAGLAPSRKKVYHTILKTRTFVILIFFNFEFFEFCPSRNAFLPTVRRFTVESTHTRIWFANRSRAVSESFGALVYMRLYMSHNTTDILLHPHFTPYSQNKSNKTTKGEFLQATKNSSV